MSAIFSRAAAAYRACRAEFSDYMENQFAAADEATSGNLLNERGRAKGISAFSLFKGSDTYANAYASEELRAWWRDNPRLTYSAFEEGWPYEEYGA